MCLLIWDDKTSINSRLMKTNGLMMTHDEDTKRFFRYSQVGALSSSSTLVTNSADTEGITSANSRIYLRMTLHMGPWQVR